VWIAARRVLEVKRFLKVRVWQEDWWDRSFGEKFGCGSVFVAREHGQYGRMARYSRQGTAGTSVTLFGPCPPFNHLA